jgi:hypothetical protein
MRDNSRWAHFTQEVYVLRRCGIAGMAALCFLLLATTLPLAGCSRATPRDSGGTHDAPGTSRQRPVEATTRITPATIERIFAIAANDADAELRLNDLLQGKRITIDSLQVASVQKNVQGLYVIWSPQQFRVVVPVGMEPLVARIRSGDIISVEASFIALDMAFPPTVDFELIGMNHR